MKKIIYALVLCMFLSSCATPMLLGEYPSNAYTITTNKSINDVWDNVVDWFFSTQTPIALIDKDSGIITSGKISLRSFATDERNKAPRDKNQYVVIPEDWTPEGLIINGKVTGRVKREGEKTKVSVFLGDLECIPMIGTVRSVEIKSTGVFENKWLEYVVSK